MKNKELVIVDGDDWQALYVDGKIWGQDHEITAEDIACAAGLKLERKFANVCEDTNEYPENLSDVDFD